MAGRKRTAATNGATERRLPVYSVFVVESDGKFTMVAPAVSAQTQEKAMDQVDKHASEYEPLRDREEYVLGAFVASSLRGKRFKAAMRRVTESEPVALFSAE